MKQVLIVAVIALVVVVLAFRFVPSLFGMSASS